MFADSGEIVFEVVDGDNGEININSADFQIIDPAGNTQNITAIDINRLINTVVKSDTTPPTISNTTIYSNNALDNSLAKTNDTITVEFVANDNFSSNFSFIGSSQILNKNTNSNINNTGIGKIELFTDGSENNETVVPFSFSISDEAGNVSNIKTTTDDNSSVRFDQTKPKIKNVEISATSVDNSASLEDIPTYYAKQGDSISLKFQTCDYVDTNNNAPRGTLFNQSVTAVDLGLTNESCETSGGQTGTWRQWENTLNNIDGAEGVITFDIEVYDNAGNNETEIIHVIGTTNSSQVIFDKTAPSLPTDVTDKQGVKTNGFKHLSEVIYTWTGQADFLSGIYYYDVNLVNDEAGYNEMAQVLAPDNVYDFNKKKTLIAANTNYEFKIRVTDKAGNKTNFENLYQQKYSANLHGQISDKNNQSTNSETLLLEMGKLSHR